MNYRFAIQASTPRFLPVFDADDQSLSDAIQTIFPLEAEYAIIMWNWVYIPLSYKYDISIMTEDIISLIELMLSKKNGNRTIQWPSNTFAATWSIEWINETTTVNAEWSCVLGETEPVLATRPIITLRTADFIGEWKRLLEVIAGALNAAGYTRDNLVEVQRLNELIGRISHYGILYRE